MRGTLATTPPEKGPDGAMALIKLVPVSLRSPGIPGPRGRRVPISHETYIPVASMQDTNLGGI